MRNTVYVRNFEAALRLLADRGHSIHVIADPHEQFDPSDLMGRLCREYPSLTHAAPPAGIVSPWTQFGIELRKAVDYLRYLEPRYEHAPKLRRRVEQKAPAFILSPRFQRATTTVTGRRFVRWLLRQGDRAVPVDPAARTLIARHRPDLVLVTPLVEPGSPQAAFLRAARSLGIPTGLCVFSWDNLTNKGLIHDVPDVVTVWNDSMRDEAILLHQVPANRIVVTGAVAYDHWFGWTPRTTRETFCARVGLDAMHPYVLYLCSSRFVAPDERSFVRQWVQEVRSRAPALRRVGVLVRPHPQNAGKWRDVDVSDLPNVAVWPRAGGNPVDEFSRADYYDSIFHSAAVVGVNTSALIESAIVGRGVYTLLAPEFRDTQVGTLHFRHLREVNGGLITVATDFAEHAAQLERGINDPAAAAEKSRRFVEAFVRPHGRGEAATPRLVAALEEAAARGPVRPYAPPSWAALIRPLLSPVATAAQRSARAAQEELRRRKAARVARAARTARG